MESYKMIFNIKDKDIFCETFLFKNSILEEILLKKRKQYNND